MARPGIIDGKNRYSAAARRLTNAGLQDSVTKQRRADSDPHTNRTEATEGQRTEVNSAVGTSSVK